VIAELKLCFQTRTPERFGEKVSGLAKELIACEKECSQIALKQLLPVATSLNRRLNLATHRSG
jgi:hypothetical protein